MVLTVGSHRIFGGWVKTMVLFIYTSGPKFMKFWDNVGDPFYFLMLFPDCLYHIPCRTYWPSKLPLSCEVVENKWFLGPKFWGPIPKKSL